MGKIEKVIWGKKGENRGENGGKKLGKKWKNRRKKSGN